jgi:hypothetical protein
MLTGWPVVIVGTGSAKIATWQLVTWQTSTRARMRAMAITGEYLRDPRIVVR